MTHLNFGMSQLDMIAELADGNPGARTAMLHLTSEYTSIDPHAFSRAITPLLWFDDHGIHGSEIWVFFKDVCGQAPAKAIVLMRAVQLGITPVLDIERAINGRRDGVVFDWKGLKTKIREMIGDFDPYNKLAT